MKLIKSLVIFTALLAATHALADKTAFIYGFAHDRITHENLINTQVSLMKGDSIISVTATNSNFNVGSKGGAWFFIVPVDGTTDYTITPTSPTSEIYAAIPGFEGQTVTLTATTMG